MGWRPVDIGLFLLFVPSYLIGIGLFFCGGMPGLVIGMIWFFGTIGVHAFVVDQVDARGRRALDAKVRKQVASAKSDEAEQMRKTTNQKNSDGALASKGNSALSNTKAIISPEIDQIVPYAAFHRPALKRVRPRTDGVENSEFFLQFLVPLLMHCIFRAGNSDYQPVIAKDDRNEERLYLYSKRRFTDGSLFPVFILCHCEVDMNQFTLYANIAYVTGGNKFMPWNVQGFEVLQPLEDSMIEGVFNKVDTAYNAAKHFLGQEPIETVLEMATLFIDNPSEYLRKAGVAVHQPATTPNGIGDDGNIFTSTEGKSTQDSAKRWESGIKKV